MSRSRSSNAARTSTLAQFAAAALLPKLALDSQVTDASRRQVAVVVPAHAWVAASGVDGVNLRLAAKLSGARIDLLRAG